MASKQTDASPGLEILGKHMENYNVEVRILAVSLIFQANTSFFSVDVSNPSEASEQSGSSADPSRGAGAFPYRT